MSEQNNANWDKNTFIGRPEPIYTYLDSERNGTISFKVIVDHPSILNLLTREFFKTFNDEEADNYINAFFAGCKDLDFYDLIRKYTTLSKNDLKKIYELTKDIESIHQKSIDAFIEQNRSLAIDAISHHRKFQRKISEIRSSIEQKNQLQIDLLDLIYMFERVSRSWADVADLVKPVY